MSRRGRWQTAAEVLGLLGRRPGITRAAVAKELRLSTGSATEVTTRLRDLQLLSELPAPIQGRGRPTTVLAAHPLGPIVLALEIRQGGWRSGVVSLDGSLEQLPPRRHHSRRPGTVLSALREVVAATQAQYGDRLRAVALAVPGTVRGLVLLQASTLDWTDVDLTPVVRDTGLFLLTGNDATLAGVAEARTGAAAGAGTALHLIVEVGIGGTLLLDGVPVGGANGTAGEYGHTPYGDRSVRCPCGARGCWDLEIDGRALARHLGEREPDDPYSYADELLRQPSVRTRQAIETVAGALGAGIAGLVNAHDPAVITLGGLAVPLRAAAPDAFAAAYSDNLMAFHRSAPPPVLDAAHPTDGVLRGAGALGLDHLTSEASLTAWADALSRS
ncbi:XylR family transcriptional regulator [Kribbella sp. ALI-6-A]|uniref:ROK family protein n=1 Tax=Kribbella sp. ALI-6-A TaxID=1933817 RepID=UPI00097C6A60|nr:ROK family protein [Kribbella sp. ALI-6-A]ONI77562.1 XylR family transcriptional regulator [Kribbella sp. ALI-6-A]